MGLQMTVGDHSGSDLINRKYLASQSKLFYLGISLCSSAFTIVGELSLPSNVLFCFCVFILIYSFFLFLFFSFNFFNFYLFI